MQAHFWGFHQDFGPFSRAVSMATPGESKLTNLSPNRCCRAPLHQEEEFGLQEPCKENPEGNAWGILVTKRCWKPKSGTDPTEQQGQWGCGVGRKPSWCSQGWASPLRCEEKCFFWK